MLANQIRIVVEISIQIQLEKPYRQPTPHHYSIFTTKVVIMLGCRVQTCVSEKKIYDTFVKTTLSTREIKIIFHKQF